VSLWSRVKFGHIVASISDYGPAQFLQTLSLAAAAAVAAAAAAAVLPTRFYTFSSQESPKKSCFGDYGQRGFFTSFLNGVKV